MQTGATIDTIGAGAPPFDSTQGYFYNSSGYSVVAVSNGQLTFTPDTAVGAVSQGVTPDIADRYQTTFPYLGTPRDGFTTSSTC